MIHDILSRLDKVRQTGSANWLACCPAHQDKHPSMTLHEASDGRILVTCWAGCSFGQIAEAVGLGWEPWFPEKIEHHLPKVRRPYPASDVLEATYMESLITATAACNLANGVEMTAADKERLMLAHERLSAARRMALGER